MAMVQPKSQKLRLLLTHLLLLPPALALGALATATGFSWTVIAGAVTELSERTNRLADRLVAHIVDAG